MINLKHSILLLMILPPIFLRGGLDRMQEKIVFSKYAGLNKNLFSILVCIVIQNSGKFINIINLGYNLYTLVLIQSSCYANLDKTFLKHQFFNQVNVTNKLTTFQTFYLLCDLLNTFPFANVYHYWDFYRRQMWQY